MKKITMLFFALAFCLLAEAQKDGMVQGNVGDSGRHPLQLATVTVFNAVDTAIITYRMTNEKGKPMKYTILAKAGYTAPRAVE